MTTEQTYDAPVLPPTHTIDVPLARKNLEFVESNPEKHDQGDWARVASWSEWATAGQGQDQLGACGTAGCFAGWLPVMEGHVVHVRNSVVVADVDGRPHVADWSRERLGLTHVQADMLFSGSNTVEHLRGLLSVFTDGEIEPPAFPYDRWTGATPSMMESIDDVREYVRAEQEEYDFVRATAP